MSMLDTELLHAARTEDLELKQVKQLAVLGEFEKDVVAKLKYSGLSSDSGCQRNWKVYASKSGRS
ncbi:hypothetical protein [Escherichia coli]|uniref:hypothetical protein n=1 Tax=Escherichia coli TaxID=562 RepID=UPI001BE45DD4|nr:hypothetical protein [Escherichia coli]